MRVSFRHRIFYAILALGTLPLASALFVLALQFESESSSTGARYAIDEIAESGRSLIAAIDTTVIDDEARAALESHTETLASRTAMARRAEAVSGYAATALGMLTLGVALALVVLSVFLARRLSRYVTTPIEELTDWVKKIERREPLPTPNDGASPAEFDVLRSALREMSSVLEMARRTEIEKERLQAFRETARQVAHEMRGPLTSMRLGIGQLEGIGAQVNDKGSVALTVLRDESQRLEQLAQEFSDFGRLPEGPAALVDIDELLNGVVAATVPSEIELSCEITPDLSVQGHYEPLRRAIQNLLRNAVEVSSGGPISVKATREKGRPEHTVNIEIADSGPGVPENMRDSIFEPYFTTKELGTGLGLAIVRQTVTAHSGEVWVDEAEGGGARFVVKIPERK